MGNKTHTPEEDEFTRKREIKDQNSIEKESPKVTQIKDKKTAEELLKDPAQTKVEEILLNEQHNPEEIFLLEKKKTEAEIDKMYRDSIEEFQNCLDIEQTPEILSYIHLTLFLSSIILIAYFIGRFRFSITYIIGLLYAVHYIYKRRIRKFKDSLKTVIYQQTRKEKVKNNWESVEWMNYIIGRVWNVLEPTISKEVFRNVNPILQEKCPPFLSSLKLTTFTLGSHPPFVVGITHFEETDHETIMIESEFGFVPLEIGKDSFSYVTKNKKYQWNSKIVLVARLGTKVKGVGLDLPVLVKKISFKGKARIILKLTQEKILIKNVEFCFMESPEIDFDLAPLKTVDLMDVPGLSNWIHTIIDASLKKAVVNPNSIVIDLSKPEEQRSVPIGVLFLRISSIKNKTKENVQVEIDVDGRKLYHTMKKEGLNILMNEYFYLILESMDDNINFKVLSPAVGRENFFGEGSLFIKKIVHFKTYLESVKIIKKGNIRSIINTQTSFFPIIKELPKPEKEDEKERVTYNSAIVRMKVLQVEDIKGENAGKNKIYSSCFTVLVSPKIETKEEEITKTSSRNPLRFVTGPVNATALLVGGAISSAGNVLGNIIPGKTKSEALLPSSKKSFFVYESKTINDTNSPFFNETFEFFSRDVRNDFIYLRFRESDDGENGEIIGKVDIPMSDANGERWYRIKDAQGGRVKIQFEKLYINMEEDEPFKEYTKAVKLDIKGMSSIYNEGVFYGIVETSSDTFFIEPFCVGDLITNREIIFPVCDDNVKINIFKESNKLDDFIGDGVIDIENASLDEKKPSSIDVSLVHKGDDNGKISMEVSALPLDDYKGASETPDIFKVMQVKFGSFKGKKEEFFIEFVSNQEVIQRSPISINGQLGQTFLLLAGKSEIRAVFRKADINNDEVIGDCLVPKRAMKEKVMLDEKSFCAEMEIKVKGCSFKKKECIKEGTVELFIRNGKSLPGVDKSGTSDPYVTVFLNGAHIHKTHTKKKTVDPVFNENISLKVNTLIDVVRFEVSDWNQFEQHQLIAFREVPLYFLTEGLCDVELKLLNGKTFKKNAGVLNLGFKFTGEDLSLKGLKTKSVFKS